MNINATLFLQAIVFAILVWFTMRFVWPPITKALDERAQKIADGLAAADKAKTELAAANKRVDEQLAQTRDETSKRLADAEKRAQAIVEEARKRADEEGAKIIAAAKAEAEQQVVRAREALREQVAVLAVKGGWKNVMYMRSGFAEWEAKSLADIDHFIDRVVAVRGGDTAALEAEATSLLAASVRDRVVSRPRVLAWMRRAIILVASM